MDDIQEPIRDERLGAALSLLQRPKGSRPGYVPLLAGCAFIGASTLLAYVVTKSPALERPAAVQKTPAKAAPNKADFQLSSAPEASAEPPPTEAVILGAEQSR